MKVFLDTNVWYHIAEKKYPYKVIKEIPLYLTAWNIVELIASPKLLMDKKVRETVILTCNEILFLKPECCPYSPNEYIAREVLEYKGICKTLGLDTLSSFISGEFSDEALNSFIKLKQEMVQTFKKEMDVQQLGFLEKIKLGENPKITIEAILVQTIREIKDNLNITDKALENIDFASNANKIAFFLKTREANNNYLNLTKKTVAKNDFGDLINTSYVNLGDKYWCSDDKWLRKTYWKGIEDFLFSFTDEE